MSEEIALTKVTRNGQITLPAEFRERLGISQCTFLRLTLRGSKIEVSPVQFSGEAVEIREFDRKELNAFLQEDKLDARTAAKVRRLLSGA
jgi:AbrB family looped-hinge helix DNA binding protein